MQLKLGEKIRELRRRDSRTQENLADTLGVTSQAVSRWESSLSYPDMELIPAIANYFGITIDELFGYENDREQKIERLLTRVRELDSRNMGCDVTFDECVHLLREGLAEFPGNEVLTLELGKILNSAGWARFGGGDDWPENQYDEEGFIRYDSDRMKQCAEWTEAVKLLEYLTETSRSPEIVNEAIVHLVCMYRVRGEAEKGVKLAERLPKIAQCREILLADGTDGKTQARYLGESLLELTYIYVEQMMYALVNCRANYETDLPIDKVKGLIGLYGLVCEDGNLGPFHQHTAWLYLYLSRVQWERGYKDEAFDSLDLALEEAKKRDRRQAEVEVKAQSQGNYTAMLTRFVKMDYGVWNPNKLAPRLPEDWPMWANPDYTEVKKEISSDPRWGEWVKRCREMEG